MISPLAVQKAIHEAFSSVPYPGDGGIGKDQDVPSDGRDIAQAFCGKKWYEIAPQTLRKHASMIGFTPQAMQYFLPAYLLGALDHPDVLDIAIDNTVWSLDPGNYADKESMKTLFASFTDKQRKAIAMFLQLLGERQGKYMVEEISSALQFWSVG